RRPFAHWRGGRAHRQCDERVGRHLRWWYERASGLWLLSPGPTSRSTTSRTTCERGTGPRDRTRSSATTGERAGSTPPPTSACCSCWARAGGCCSATKEIRVRSRDFWAHPTPFFTPTWDGSSERLSSWAW